MQNRQKFFIVFLTITILTFLLWWFSKFIQPILPPSVNNDLVLWVTCLNGVVTILTGVPDIIERFTKRSTGENTEAIFAEKQNQHNREILLDRVWDTWIEGMLKKSLYNEVQMELGLELHPEWVENLWGTVLQMPGKTSKPIPASKKILDVFNESSKSLIIVGEPGSGKTTELLELASQAIAIARKDSWQPIPVVFNLSTWKPALNFHDWLMKEFWERYRIPSQTGNYWVNTNEILLLLDGFDEVKQEYQNQCAQSINDFLQQQIVSIAICCRKDEFERLKTQIKIQGVLRIKPLTREQTINFLRKAGEKFVDIYNKIERDSDPAYLNFIHTPLFISILILAYKNATVQQIETLVNSSDYRKQLFDFYINQMFKRRGKPKYTIEQTNRWLKSLANNMIKNDNSVFYIQNIQQNWLENKMQINLFMLTKNVIILLIFLLGLGLIPELFPELISKYLFVPILVLIFNLSPYPFVFKDEFESKQKWLWSWSKFVFNFFAGLIWGGITGLIFGVILGVLFGKNVGVISGIGAGLGLTISEWLNNTLRVLLVTRENQITSNPSKLLQRSLVKSLLFWFIFELSAILFIRLSGRINGDVFVGVILWLSIGLIYDIIVGGGFLINHFLLRMQLHLTNSTPLRLIPFLDFATERVLLRKVGGGYIFIHRMVMEHFAEMDKKV